jgi:hypothetical protein
VRAAGIIALMLAGFAALLMLLTLRNAGEAKAPAPASPLREAGPPAVDGFASAPGTGKEAVPLQPNVSVESEVEAGGPFPDVSSATIEPGSHDALLIHDSAAASNGVLGGHVLDEQTRAPLVHYAISCSHWTAFGPIPVGVERLSVRDPKAPSSSGAWIRRRSTASSWRRRATFPRPSGPSCLPQMRTSNCSSASPRRWASL